MSDFIPPFELQRVLFDPWQGEFSASQPSTPLAFWIALMGFCVSGACGLVGNYLMLRRMALIGDAISHSVLPGIAFAFLATGSRSSGVMFAGALVAGVVTTLIIEAIHRNSRIKQDSAIGIAFTSLFAIGVILISIYAGQVDLDQECVLYGEIGFVPLQSSVSLAGYDLGPAAFVRMALVLLGTIVLIVLFYKELLVTSFDPGLATSLGIRAGFVHYALMCWLSVVVVSAFESVGAILVIAMLILPGATASLISHRLPVIMALTLLHCAISSVVGVHMGYWLNCSMAAAMVVAGTFLFVLAWLFSPSQGLLRKLIRSRALVEEAPELAPARSSS